MILIYNLLLKQYFDEQTFINIKNRKYYSLLSRKNEKEVYSLEKALSHLKTIHPIKISSSGSINDIKKLKNEDVYKQYKKIISRSIEIYAVGDFADERIIELVKEIFSR